MRNSEARCPTLLWFVVAPLRQRPLPQLLKGMGRGDRATHFVLPIRLRLTVEAGEQ